MIKLLKPKPVLTTQTKDYKTYKKLEKTDGTNVKKPLLITKMLELLEMLTDKLFLTLLDWSINN
jgi:hypothetical protein